MKKVTHLRPEFVEYVPDKLDEGTLYVSMKYATASHLCCCGCGQEVVTPFSPTDWRLMFDGKTISLDPSIGNWSFDCRSHYFIRQNRVVWAGAWSKEHVVAGRAHDERAKGQHYEEAESKASPPPQKQRPRGRWERFKQFFGLQ